MMILMPPRLTEDEWDRIREFASKAPYERTPEMLIPEDARQDQ